MTIYPKIKKEIYPKYNRIFNFKFKIAKNEIFIDIIIILNNFFLKKMRAILKIK